ncbi:hypothetical protein BDB01DRAFT_717738 [Pilobolus umbonatus]|nr:hypothetical protein BDB01DRAFT_717738 [Pilobolus umbonatus]
MNDGNTARLQIVQLENRKEDEVYYKDPIDTLKQVDRILGYFYKYMFNGNNAADGICLVFGNLLLCDLIKMMISKSLQPAIPSSDGTLSDFDRIAKAAKVFEDRCITAYGFQLKSVDTNTLSNYVDNIDKHYAKKRREKILTNGRNVMLRKLYDSEPVEVREDIHLQHYQITQTPQLISVLISDTISEASNLMHSHPISASNLIEGVHDLLDMYRSITPSYHRSQFLSSPATSLVFRNDCYWLANKLTNSISKMKEVKLFDNLLSIINNAAMKLQELGKAWYELTMLQRMQMIQMLHTSFDGFTGIAEDPKQQKQCENTLFGIIELTKSFAVETRSVVDVNLFMDMMGRIVDNVIMIFIKDIEDLHDIGATDSHVIAVHLNSMAQLVSAFDLPDKDATDSFVAELVPNWQKFWLIKDILEMNMKEIMEAFRQGDLHMFEKSELVNLVCALFADTELRESNLREIQKSGTYRADDQADASNSFLPYTQSPSTNQSARSVSPSLSTSSASRSTSGLEYNMDDMDEMEIGWEEEEDLFQDNSYPVEYDKEKTETESINSKLSMSLDDLNDEELSGWGDADESLFKEDQLSNMATSQPVTSSSSKSPQVTTVSPSLNKTKTPTMHPETTSSLLSAPELEIDEEDGWGWEDEDLFIKDPK